MKIGITAPVLINSLSSLLPAISSSMMNLGMGAPAVNSLIHGLVNNGYKVSVYTLDENVLEPLIIHSEFLTVYIGNYRKSAKKRCFSLFNKESDCLKRFIEKDNPDIVNAHWTYEFADAALKSGFPHLITVRDHSKTMLMMQKDYYRFFRFILDYKVRCKGENFSVNSIYLQQLYSGWKKNLPVIPNSINNSFISKTGKRLPEGKLKIISVLTGWNIRKNAKNALRAFSIIRKKCLKNIEYHIYGPGYNQNGFAHQWAVTNQLSEDVCFKGYISHEYLMSLLPQYDLLLHPAIEESFGNTLLEGMAKGLPVVGGKDSGAVPWVLNFGKNGILTDVTSPERIADSVLELINHKTLYEELSHSGIRYICSKFIPTVIAEKYIKLYRKILYEE